MRLGIVAPLNPRETGVAGYVLDLASYLSKAIGEPLWLFSKDRVDVPGLAGCAFHSVDELPEMAAKVDLLIYQMGNSPAHDFMAPFLQEYPGLVVLHDPCLYHYFTRQALEQRKLSWYIRAFGFAYGSTQLAYKYLAGLNQPRYPEVLLSEWLVTRSPGVIVHSHHAAAILKKRCPTSRIWVIPMPIPLPAKIDKNIARAQLGIPSDSFVVIIFGVINESKNPSAILDALAFLITAGVPAQAVFIGIENSNFLLMPEAEKRGLQSYVRHLGFVESLSAVNLWLSVADVGIGLRTLYWGETPSSVLRMMAAGLPTIVNDVGAFSELPDSACVKIPPDNSEVAEQLFVELMKFYQNPDSRERMGASARRYIQQAHNPMKVAMLCIKSIRTILFD
jgi:glycosyltransferase involved in cell wall biosynthesis